MSGSVEMFPGKVLAEGERVNRAALNQLGAPTGRVGANEITDRELDEDSVVTIAARNGLPNFLINGNFDIWQRGGYTNFLSLPATFGASADSEFTADRWMATDPPGGTNTREISRGSFDLDQTVVPNSPMYYLHWKQTVGDTSPTLEQRIESVRTLAGKTVTVSGWVKSNTSGNLSIGFYQFFGGSPGQTVTVTPQTFAVTGGAAWVKFEKTFAIPSLAGYEIGGDLDRLSLTIAMPSSVTFETDFAQIKVEQSARATAYVVLSPLEELQHCERYFEYHGGVAFSTITAGPPTFYFATRKYRAPTLTLIAGYSGTMTAANFTAMLDTGYFQDTANSVVSAFFMACDAEIY